MELGTRYHVALAPRPSSASVQGACINEYANSVIDSNGAILRLRRHGSRHCLDDVISDPLGTYDQAYRDVIK